MVGSLFIVGKVTAFNQGMTMSAFYLVFIIIDLFIGFPLLKDWKHLLNSSVKTTTWYIAALLIALSSLLWLVLLFVTVSSWIESMGPGPKPYFLVMWVIVLFVYGIVRSVRGLIRFPVGKKEHFSESE